MTLAQWPRTPSGNYLCNPSHPRPTNAPGLWVHAVTEEIGEQDYGVPGGGQIIVRCKVCGIQWPEQLGSIKY